MMIGTDVLDKHTPSSESEMGAHICSACYLSHPCPTYSAIKKLQAEILDQRHWAETYEIAYNQVKKASDSIIQNQNALSEQLKAAEERADEANEQLNTSRIANTNLVDCLKRTVQHSDTLAERLRLAEYGLEWYEEQVRNCIKIGTIPEGERARNNLANDAGKTARDTLALIREEGGK